MDIVINGKKISLKSSIEELTYAELVELAEMSIDEDYTIKYRSTGRRVYTGTLLPDHYVKLVGEMVFNIAKTGKE